MAPINPKTSMSADSISRGSAYTLRSWYCCPQLMSMADTAAPQINASNAPNALSSSVRLPSTRPSATWEAKPVMCDVYMCSTRNPPAFTAPALNASSRPRVVLVDGERCRPVRKRSRRMWMPYQPG